MAVQVIPRLQGRESWAVQDCAGCGASLRFNKKDVRMGRENGPYVVCPECDSPKTLPDHLCWREPDPVPRAATVPTVVGPDHGKRIYLRVRLGQRGYDTLVWDEASGAVLLVGNVSISTKAGAGPPSMTLIDVPISLEADVENPFRPLRAART